MGYGWAMESKDLYFKPFFMAQIMGYDSNQPLIAHNYSVLWGYGLGYGIM